MTHWDIARGGLIGAFIAASAIAGYIAGGLGYLG